LISVVDYGLGNVQAFLNIFHRLNVPARAATSAEDLRGSSKLVLPGVGSFDWAMSRLNASGMRDSLHRMVREEGVPLLGVCVGMQMLCQGSEEGTAAGLGWVDAEVRRFKVGESAGALPLPHMGWNDVKPTSRQSLFRELGDPRFYFLHTYYVEAARSGDVLAMTDYGGGFASAIAAENIYGTQFHPEKSHHWGIGLLRNFSEL
jgi:glutamine amidotransferase